MLRNLVENALRHAREGGEVEVRSERHDRVVEIHVSDDGQGVADDDRERIFEPFYRAPDARALSPDGSGLGLAIAREIARAHSGDITLAPPARRPQGARFIVRLPLSAAAAPS
jgi:signal transduction histidine kinase